MKIYTDILMDTFNLYLKTFTVNCLFIQQISSSS